MLRLRMEGHDSVIFRDEAQVEGSADRRLQQHLLLSSVRQRWRDMDPDVGVQRMALFVPSTRALELQGFVCS